MTNLSPLVALLQACPTRDTSISSELLRTGWEELRREETSPAILTALVLHDLRFQRLVTSPEYQQLAELSRLIQMRYEQRIHPPNPLGLLMAGIIKKESP